jgi:uncharacterized NAD-dependent epimerase/dehydratase family protein
MNDFFISDNPENPFKGIYEKNTRAIILAHGLMGTVRSKSANGLLIHNKLFDIVAIVDKNAAGCDTSKICPGVNVSVPIFSSLSGSLKYTKADVLILLVPPFQECFSDLHIAVQEKMDLINTSFYFIKNDPFLLKLVNNTGIRFFDLRDVTDQKAYPNVQILNRRAKVVFVTGTDCGMGKRTATYELTREARRQGINAVMYATGQTGLMIGERGTVIDSLIIEFSNGVISQHVTQFDNEGYELIFVEGQSDIFHPANSAMSLALLHGANPDCLILVHDENRKVHKGFEEDSPLYKMHPVQNYIRVLEMLSLPCGPIYKTVGIATIGQDNIKKIRTNLHNNIPVSDVRIPGGPAFLLEAILTHLDKEHKWIPAYKICIN